MNCFDLRLRRITAFVIRVSTHHRSAAPHYFNRGRDRMPINIVTSGSFIRFKNVNQYIFIFSTLGQVKMFFSHNFSWIYPGVTSREVGVTGGTREVADSCLLLTCTWTTRPGWPQTLSVAESSSSSSSYLANPSTFIRQHDHLPPGNPGQKSS